MPRFTVICTFLVLSILALPGVGYIFGIGTSEDYIKNAERRLPQTFPNLGTILKFGEWASSFDAAVADRFPYRSRIIKSTRSFDWSIGGRRVFGDVSLGKNDWMFYRVDSGQQLRGKSYIEDFFERLDRTIAFADSRQLPFIVIVIPPKQIVHQEMLSDSDQSLTVRFEPLRNLFYTGLESYQPDRIPRIWVDLKALAGNGNPLVFHPQDTHYTHVGAIVVGRSIVEAFSPGLWQDSAVRNTEGTSVTGDLVSMAGFSSGWKSWKITYSEIHRDGVRIVSRDVPDQQMNPYDPARFTSESDSGITLIPGKTLIVHDSFIGGFLRDSLAMYFEDVTYLHSNNLAEIDLKSVMVNYDRVVLQMTERSALTVMTMVDR